MLQIGAFARSNFAEDQRVKLESLGLPALVKEEPRLGRILYLVQSGPYGSRQQLEQVEAILRANNIDSRRMSLTLNP